MMKNTIISLAILLNSQLVFSQPDSTLLDYYPLQIGNYWEYQEEVRDFYRGSNEYSYFSVEVVADTTMSNGKTYMKLIKKSIPDTMQYEVVFERFDSVSFNIYRYGFSPLNRDEDDFLIDSLSLPVGEFFEGYSRKWYWGSMELIAATISHINSKIDTVFEMLLPVKHFSANNHFTHPDTYEYWLTQGIGVTRGYEGEIMWEYHLTLLYAEINEKIYGTPTSINKGTNTVSSFMLYQNYPNPFNPSTIISYSLEKSGKVELVVINILGQKVTTLYNGFQNAGIYSINFNAENFVAGLYIYQIKFGNQSQRRKLLLLK